MSEDRIAVAIKSLQDMFQVETLRGATFLDIGCGSGMFSLAAMKLGANVHSFDFDPESVACTTQLKNRYFSGYTSWTIETASVLDKNYMSNLGVFDFVYAWGVLHHTGNLRQAMANVNECVKIGGNLFVAIYNDQGRASKRWLSIKKAYLFLPDSLKWLVLIPCFIRLWGPSFIRDLIKLNPARSWIQYSKNRGMSPFRDVIDWVGGFPFEVSKPEGIFNFYKELNYDLTTLKTCAGGLGCNEFVFKKR